GAVAGGEDAPHVVRGRVRDQLDIAAFDLPGVDGAAAGRAVLLEQNVGQRELARFGAEDGATEIVARVVVKGGVPHRQRRRASGVDGAVGAVFEADAVKHDVRASRDDQND